MTGPVTSGPARRLLVMVVLAVLSVGGLWLLAAATQTRADQVPADHVTEVVFRVEGKRYPAASDGAAALWAACQGTTRSRTAEQVGAGDRYTVVLEPAIGTNARRRLVGCLRDATLDRLRGEVLSIETRPAG